MEVVLLRSKARFIRLFRPEKYKLPEEKLHICHSLSFRMVRKLLIAAPDDYSLDTNSCYSGDAVTGQHCASENTSIPQMSGHEQVWVKVNAPVDRGVAELVQALSVFPRLRTVESCEGNGDWAWVCFVYGRPHDESWKELAQFVLGEIGPRLVGELGDRVNISVQMTEAGQYRAEMAVRKAAIPAAVKLLGTLGTESRAA